MENERLLGQAKPLKKNGKLERYAFRCNIIIDGGNAVECATQPYEHWGSTADNCYPEMRIEQGCVNELQRLGIEPDSVTYVLQSHLHLDHTGAIGRFPNAIHIVQRAEYELSARPQGEI